MAPENRAWAGAGLPLGLCALAYLIWGLPHASGYAMRVLALAGVYALLAVGYFFIFGLAGALSLAQGSFMGVGAYVSGILATRYDVPFDLALPASVGLPVLLALIVAVPVLRLQTHYFALATLLIGQIALMIATQAQSITGGANGIGGVPPLSLAGFPIIGRLTILLLTWALVAGGALLAWQIARGRLGDAFAILRDHPSAARSIGLDIGRLRLMAFLLSAAYAGLAGSLYVHEIGVVSPDVLGFPVMVTCLTIAVVGSRLRVLGAIVGAILIIELPEWVRFLQDDDMLAFGAILLLVIVALPGGLIEAADHLLGRLWTAPPVTLFQAPKRLPRADRRRHARRSTRSARDDLSGHPRGSAPQVMVEVAEFRPEQDGSLLPTSVQPNGVDGRTRAGHDTSTSRTKGRQVLLAPVSVGNGGWRGRGVLLEVTGLGRSFGGVRALEDVSLTLEAGEVLGLIGPNGSGKTTLLNVITGIFPPDAGRVTFDGRVISGRAPHRIARLGMARTFQTAALVGQMSALDNVAVARNAAGLGLRKALLAGMRERAHARAEAIALLDRMGAASAAGLLAGTLPPGLARRVEIARALACAPCLLLLDEPAAGLNETEQADLVTRLRKVADEGVALLVIEHNMAFMLALVDRLICLDNGRIIASGTPQTVQADPRVIEAYLGAPISAFR